jgi:hypothetical protein
MNRDRGARDGDAEAAGIAALGRRAAAAWVRRGRAGPLARWLVGVLDKQGVPRRLSVPAWAELLAVLDEARRGRPERWPDALDARVEALLLATIRFARAGGAAVFTPPAARPDEARGGLFRAWAERLTEPGLATVLDWWFPRPATTPTRARAKAARHRTRSVPAAPPLPAWSSAERPLAILRANWSVQGDLLAIDQRQPGGTALVELTGLGQVWLGPTWAAENANDPGAGVSTSTPRPGRPARARPRLWVSSSSADLAEWSFRLGPGASGVTRTALLLRGRRLALLADQVERISGNTPAAAWRIALPAGVEASPLAGRAGWTLAPPRGSPLARLVPLALPCTGGTGERGTFTREGRELRLCQPCPGRRCWLPLLVSWDPLRNRQAIHWRVLTVSEQSRVCPPDRAFAARVTWGRRETLVIYRSLAPPALRAFLGHQTRARFLVALFDRDGTVTPIVALD